MEKNKTNKRIKKVYYETYKMLDSYIQNETHWTVTDSETSVARERGGLEKIDIWVNDTVRRGKTRESKTKIK